jgi:hypothetical protein
VLKLVTSAQEERDALPEELSSQLNKILYDVGEVDNQTAGVVEMQSVPMRDDVGAGSGSLGVSLGRQRSRAGEQRPAPRERLLAPMAPEPIDAGSTPVVLSEVRRKLGEISRTTLLRLVNE